MLEAGDGEVGIRLQRERPADLVLTDIYMPGKGGLPTSRTFHQALAVALGALAVMGGEYGTLDWLKLRRQLAQEREAVRDLRVELDSLERLAVALETDPAVQERAAREQFGMIRDGEILYRLVPEQDSGAGARRR